MKFWWKVSSEGTCDFLEFYIDGDERDSISGETTWAEMSYTISGTGTHTLRWRYAKSGTGSVGEDRAWVDHVQWTGAMEEPDPNDWRTLNYVYDAAGRRIEKKYDGRSVLKHVYDGDHCIAEYDAGGNLRRKYIYGPGVDQPICMIEAPQTDPNYYYYHFDGLGNVVALTDDEGDTVQVYEYDVYGRVAALDASHPNRIMFTAREFDKETGLYYYRARYYKPEIGRFLQVDPVGYCAGMNLYRYCNNNPWNRVDPWGLDDSNDSNDSNDANDANEWSPDWDGYNKCMKKAKDRYNDCMDRAKAFWDEVNGYCNKSFEGCVKGCHDPMWPHFLRPLCTQGCYEIWGLCWAAANLAYNGMAGACAGWYVHDSAPCAQYLTSEPIDWTVWP